MIFSGFNYQSQSFILLLNVKMPTIVGILTFLNRINFRLSQVEHEKCFVSLGLKLVLYKRRKLSDHLNVVSFQNVCKSFLINTVDSEIFA